jgi:hypothetical protein
MIALAQRDQTDHLGRVADNLGDIAVNLRTLAEVAQDTAITDGVREPGHRTSAPVTEPTEREVTLALGKVHDYLQGRILLPPDDAIRLLAERILTEHPLNRACEGCGAEPGERCRPGCLSRVE